MISRLVGSIKTMLTVFFLTHTCAQREMETGYCRRAIILKYSCAASEIRTMQHKVRQGEAKSDISAARAPSPRWFIYNRFSTVNPRPHVLTLIHPCLHSSRAQPRSFNSHTRTLFSCNIGRTPCTFTLFPSAAELNKGNA